MFFLTFITLLLFLLLVSPQSRTVNNYSYLVFAVIIMVLLGTLLGLSFITITSTVDINNLFVSDEIGYINAIEFAPFGSARGGWYSLNYLLIHHDAYGHFALRFVNVIIAGFILVYVARIFSDGRLALFIIALCPFILAMTYFNLRDLSIILSALIVTEYLKEKKYIGVAVGVLMLLVLRPLMIFVFLGLWLFFTILDSKSKEKNKNISSRIFILIFISVPVAVIGYDYLAGYIDYMTYLSSADDVEHRTLFANENSSLVLAILTYIFAPLPTSLFERMITSGVTEYGFFHDVLRVLNQLVFFIVLGLITLFSKSYIRALKREVRRLTVEQVTLIFYLLIHAVVYAIHLAGTGHSRLKLPFQIGFMILFYLSFLRKKKSS